MANPLANYRGRVKFARTWESDWITVPGAYPLRCLRGCAPIEQYADIHYDFGEIKRENATAFTIETPKDFRDWYVRIELYDPDNPSTGFAHWHGIVPRMTRTDRGGVTAAQTGMQQVQAVGLEHLLDRVTIADSKALQDGQIVNIEWTPTFNVKYRKGHRIKGNRSKLPGPDGVYVFSNAADAAVWNNKQIIEYLLHYFKPDGPQWTLFGQYDALSQIEEVHKSSQSRSLWDWLNVLVDRRRGMGFIVEPDLGETEVRLRVFTLTNEDVVVGPRTLPANANQTDFTIPSSFPETHLVEPIKFIRTTAGVYDTIEVRGERILGVTTVSYENAQIKIASTQAERDAYVQASEEERTADRFDGTWNRFIFNPNWTYNVSTILGVQCNESMLFSCDDDGNVTAGGGRAWHDATILERTLPFKRNVDYSTNPPRELYEATERPEFLPTMVFVKLPTDVPGGGKYRLVDRLSEGETQLPNCHVRTLDTRAGFEVGASPRHLLALTRWPKDGNGAFINVVQIPRIDDQTLAATVAFRSDARLKVVRTIDASIAHEANRKLIIEVPGAEYWYALRGTVVDSGAGQLKRINDANRKLRDDADILRGVAAFAQSWYQVERQSVEIALKKIDNHVELGALLTEVTGQYSEPINTVVSSAETDFRTGTITYQTGWGEFDVIGGMLDERRGLASRRANEIEYLVDD